MEFTTTDVIQLVVAVIALVSCALGLIKYIDAKQKDTQHELTAVHTRINEVRDQYVKRPELDRELKHINDSLGELKAETRQSLADINSGLRGLQASMTQLATALVASKDNGGGHG